VACCGGWDHHDDYHDLVLLCVSNGGLVRLFLLDSFSTIRMVSLSFHLGQVYLKQWSLHRKLLLME
jgi:hypothetical protein